MMEDKSKHNQHKTEQIITQGKTKQKKTHTQAQSDNIDIIKKR